MVDCFSSSLTEEVFLFHFPTLFPLRVPLTEVILKGLILGLLFLLLHTDDNPEARKKCVTLC